MEVGEKNGNEAGESRNATRKKVNWEERGKWQRNELEQEKEWRIET